MVFRRNFENNIALVRSRLKTQYVFLEKSKMSLQIIVALVFTY